MTSIKIVILVFIGAVMTQTGCATYQGKVEKARQHIVSHEYTAAEAHLKPLADEESGDQLIYLLDYATTLQMSGQLKESNNYFFKAEKLAEQLDYHSISRITGSLLMNEEMKQYKGDTFEKIFINAYLAMNYLEMGNLDDALVEARRINDKYKLYRSEEKKVFELNSFAKYLSAMIWEADKKYDDAFIAYKEAYELDSKIETIKEDILRTAKKSQRMDEYKRYKKEFMLNSESADWYDKDKATLVVIFQQGWGPRKKFNPRDVKFPILTPVITDTKKLKVKLAKDNKSLTEEKTQFVYDVEAAAIKTFQDDQASLLARRVGAFVAKEVTARELSRRDDTLGFLAWIFMHASERADLRQWSTLPETIQVARVYLSPGEYQLSLQGLSGFGYETADHLQEKRIKLEKGKTLFVNFRSTH